MRRWLWMGLGLLVVLCLLPLVLALGASGVAMVAGCEALRGYHEPCLLVGRDIGPWLAGAVIGGAGFLVTGPVALICVIGMMVLGVTADRPDD